MKRAFRRSIAGAFLMLACATAGFTGTADAQVSTPCCTFTTTVPFTVPDGCLPIDFDLSWNGTLQRVRRTTKGPNVSSNIPNCNGGSTLDSVSVNGGPVLIPTFPLPSSSAPFLLPCGTCVVLTVASDPQGCLVIGIQPSSGC